MVLPPYTSIGPGGNSLWRTRRRRWVSHAGPYRGGSLTISKSTRWELPTYRVIPCDMMTTEWRYHVCLFVCKVYSQPMEEEAWGGPVISSRIMTMSPHQTSHLSVYIRRNPYFNHFLRGISVFGYYPYFSVFCINCRLINQNPQLTLCSWTVPRTHAWGGTIVRPLPGELRPRGPIHVTPLGSIITNTATPLRNIESAQCRMRRHRIPV